MVAWFKGSGKVSGRSQMVEGRVRQCRQKGLSWVESAKEKIRKEGEVWRVGKSGSRGKRERGKVKEHVPEDGEILPMSDGSSYVQPNRTANEISLIRPNLRHCGHRARRPCANWGSGVVDLSSNMHHFSRPPGPATPEVSASPPALCITNATQLRAVWEESLSCIRSVSLKRLTTMLFDALAANFCIHASCIRILPHV